MIRVIASMGCKIESDRQPALACRQIAPVEVLDSLAVEKPEYWRMVQGRPVYMVARGPLT